MLRIYQEGLRSQKVNHQTKTDFPASEPRWGFLFVRQRGTCDLGEIAHPTGKLARTADAEKCRRFCVLALTAPRSVGMMKAERHNVKSVYTRLLFHRPADDRYSRHKPGNERQ